MSLVLAPTFSVSIQIGVGVGERARQIEGVQQTFVDTAHSYSGVVRW